MPTVDEYNGLRFFFYSNEESRIHIHVASPDGEAKFWIEGEIELHENHGLKPKDLKIARQRIEQKQADYVKAWRKHLG
jgi:hypothetical protein